MRLSVANFNHGRQLKKWFAFDIIRLMHWVQFCHKKRQVKTIHCNPNKLNSRFICQNIIGKDVSILNKEVSARKHYCVFETEFNFPHQDTAFINANIISQVQNCFVNKASKWLMWSILWLMWSILMSYISLMQVGAQKGRILHVCKSHIRTIPSFAVTLGATTLNYSLLPSDLSAPSTWQHSVGFRISTGDWLISKIACNY